MRENSDRCHISDRCGFYDGAGAPAAETVCRFLADYGAVLLGSGATCIRLERNVTRIAAAWGMRVEFAIMPQHLHMTVWNPDTGQMVTTVATVAKTGISFDINTRLSQLSWAIADGKADFTAALERFHDIIKGEKQNPWLLILLVAVANASFCRLFGGDSIAMAIVFVATAVGYRLKQVMLRRGADLRVTVLACSFVSAVIGAGGALFDLGQTAAVALGTSVLYLVPGIPFLNSFSDLLYKHYICAFGRFMDAVVLTGCLSVGLCAGMLLLHQGMF